MSIHDLLKILKSRNVNIATLTRQQVLDAGYDGNCGISLVISDVKRAEAYRQNPPKPKRRRTTKRKRTRKADTGRQTRRSFHAEQVLSRVLAMAEQVERVNEAETVTDDNQLQLFNATPGQRYPTYKVYRPGDANYRQPEASTAPMVAGVDY